jgi:hypothetical protein
MDEIARKELVRFQPPTYRIELILRPHPAVKRGTIAHLSINLSGVETVEEMVYQGNGRWLAKPLADWLGQE